MKKLAYVMIGFAAAAGGGWLNAQLISSAHAADASACYSISDADVRSYCIAKARHDASACYTIQRGDLRAQCQAEVR